MNKRTVFIRTSMLGLMLMWSGLAFAQSRVIEPVEAKLMAKSGEGTAAKKGAATTNQEKTARGEAKQLKAQPSDSAKGKRQGEAKQARAQKSEAQKSEAKMTQAKAGVGEAKQAKAQKGEGSALRQATRTAENSRIREQKRDHSSVAERGAGNGSGECGHSETAEHRQERRGGSAGGAGAAKGAGTGAGAGNGAGKGGGS